MSAGSSLYSQLYPQPSEVYPKYSAHSTNICCKSTFFTEKDNYKEWMRWLQALLLLAEIHSRYKNDPSSRKQETKMFIKSLLLYYGQMLYYIM